MTPSAATVRFKLELSEELHERLNRLATDTGTSMAEFFRRALALAEVAVEARKQGHAIAVVDKQSQKVVRTVVGL